MTPREIPTAPPADVPVIESLRFVVELLEHLSGPALHASLELHDAGAMQAVMLHCERGARHLRALCERPEPEPASPALPPRAVLHVVADSLAFSAAAVREGLARLPPGHPFARVSIERCEAYEHMVKWLRLQATGGA